MTQWTTVQQWESMTYNYTEKYGWILQNTLESDTKHTYCIVLTYKSKKRKQLGKTNLCFYVQDNGNFGEMVMTERNH